MRVSFNVSGKVVLAVVAVGALCVGSFYAGAHHGRLYERNHPFDYDGMAKKYGVTVTRPTVLVISQGTETSWCKSHPSTQWKWTAQGLPEGSTIDGGSGSCGANGQVWDDVPNK